MRPDVLSPAQIWALNTADEGLRYLIVASLAFVVFWVWGRERFHGKLIQGSYPRAAKMWHDFRWSLSTVAIYSVFGVGVYYAGKAGILKRYEQVSDHGWAWFGLSVLILIVLQDTYFYWTHRAMHHPRLYKTFHLLHHQSTNPSPFTAYAFAPTEALVHAVFVPLVWYFLPLHEIAVFLFLLFMMIRNVHGHLSMELYSPGFTTNPLTSWSTTTTHHNLHHKYFTTNYGLYFTFWDRLMGTTDARYHDTFERIAAAPLQEPPPRGLVSGL